MYVRHNIECGFLHMFNNDTELNKLVKLMKKNPDAKFKFELEHLGRPSDFFTFEISRIEDNEYGYYICTKFEVNGKGIITWDDAEDDVPWSAIRSRLYEILIVGYPV